MNKLEKVFAQKFTENGDLAYNTTGQEMLDLMFMASYFEKHLNEVSIGNSDKEKLFSMFIRDPRLGMGRRDLGRVLMAQSGVSLQDKVAAGRFDDVSTCPMDKETVDFLYAQLKAGNKLAKKWMPRLTGKNGHIAKQFCKIAGISEKAYRALIKVETVESHLSQGSVQDINYSHVPSLAMMKYITTFYRKDGDRFAEYLQGVKGGTEKINVATTTVYDLYRNLAHIDNAVDTIFEAMEKIAINCVAIVDTSASMMDSVDSFGKALAIGHYLGKCSTYCPNQVVSFSSEPKLITLGKTKPERDYYSRVFSSYKSTYAKEILSMYTGDCSNTNLAAVLDLLSGLEEYPEYFVVLSDMEFDYGSRHSMDSLMEHFKKVGCNTKIVWWNFNSHSKTVPQLDEHGNIFMSGYSPMLLKYLEAGFDGQQFLDKLLTEYAKNLTS